MGPCTSVPLTGFLCMILWLAVGTGLCVLGGLFFNDDSPWKGYFQLGAVFGGLLILAILAGTIDWVALAHGIWVNPIGGCNA